MEQEELFYQFSKHNSFQNSADFNFVVFFVIFNQITT